MLAFNARGHEAVATLEREVASLPPHARERRLLLATQLGLAMLLDELVVDASARIEREAETGGRPAPSRSCSDRSR